MRKNNKLFSIYIKKVAKYFPKNKEMFQRKACENYQNLSKEEKDTESFF